MKQAAPRCLTHRDTIVIKHPKRTQVAQVAKSDSSCGSCSPVMPLSTEQKGMLKDPTTKVKFEQENPKSPGSKAYQRYERYKGSTTIQDATQHGAN